MANPPLKLTRDQLSAFLQDFEQIKQFENLFLSVDQLTPAVPVNKGGTGLTTIPTNGQLLIGNGTGYALNTLTPTAGIGVTNGSGSITLSNTGVLSFSAGTTGLTPAVATNGAVTLSGTLIVGNGGTGATTLTGVVKGNGTAPFTAGQVNLSTEVTGTLPVTNGGTGQTSYVNGELLIGNTTGNTLVKATLTAGANITITNGGGSITIAVSGLGTMAFENVGVSGSFTAGSGEVVTVTNGIITSIV